MNLEQIRKAQLLRIFQREGPSPPDAFQLYEIIQANEPTSTRQRRGECSAPPQTDQPQSMVYIGTIYLR